ncbi:GNAT family N-acetyltransferase [uncultured Erythrobacter sp.]|uniref:GNAT family N-acetyltransferase n=1 Tax=uncultured Erythrobacter sp. TaxID=263913 RepID=UPI00261D4270|nr:GNAT family N-acetyltransferase [uncultured Erythrobacter sp.]
MTRLYQRLPALEASLNGYSLRCVQDTDIEAIRRWRNAQMEVLRQAAPISSLEQEQYFARTIWPQMELERPRTILAAILQGDRAIGYGGLVHCAWEHKRAEISALFAPEIARDRSAYRAALLAFLEMIRETGFMRLGFNRLTLETYDIRPFHIGVLEEAGFQLEGRLRDHVVIDGKATDSLLHAALAKDQQAAGGRITSCATRSIRVPATGGV